MLQLLAVEPGHQICCEPWVEGLLFSLFPRRHGVLTRDSAEVIDPSVYTQLDDTMGMGGFGSAGS